MQKLTWPAVGLIAVLAGAVVALATLTDMSTEAIFAVVSLLGGIGGGAAITSGMAGRVEQLRQETTSQTEILNTVERRTNGELDARIAAAMEEAAEMGAARALTALRDQDGTR